MGKKKRVHKTTKNTLAKPPITRLAEYTANVNGLFTIKTDLTDERVFDKLYRQWFDDSATNMWCGSSLRDYLRVKLPTHFFHLKEDFDKIVAGRFEPATKEEWEAENN